MAHEPDEIRDEKGRYKPGCSGNPNAGGARPGAGRPPLARRELLDAVIDKRDWEAMFEVAKKKALAGDFKFLEFLIAQRFGPMVQALEINGSLGVGGLAKLSEDELQARIVDLERRSKGKE